MYWKYENYVQLNSQRWAQTHVQTGPDGGYLLIEMIWIRWCPVHTSDVDESMCTFAGNMIVPTETLVHTAMDTMDYIVRSTADACCTVQQLYHILSCPDFPLQLSFNWPLSLFYQRCSWNLAAGVYRFSVGSILKWWCTKYIFNGLLISGQNINAHSGTRIVVDPWLLWVIATCRW